MGKINRHNGVDPDFDRRKRYFRLDSDERSAGVERGRSIRGKGKVLKLVLLGAFLVAPLIIILYKNNSLPTNGNLFLKKMAAYRVSLNNGDLDQARVVLQDAYDFSLRHFGQQSVPTYDCLNELTNINTIAGNYSDALATANLALETGRKLFQGNNPREIQAIQNLGNLCYHKGEFRAARA